LKLWQQQPYVRVSLLYAVVAGLWIFLSDPLFRLLFSDERLQSAIQAYKGWLFLLLSAVLIFMLMRRESRSAARAERPSGDPTSIRDTADDGLIATDPQFRIVRVNKVAEQILRLGRAELVGHKLWEVFPEAAPSAIYPQCVRAVTCREPVRFMEYHPGLEALLEVRAYPSADGLSLYFRRVEEQGEPAESLRFHAQVIEAVESAVLALDLEGRITYWNGAAARLFGWSAAVVTGEPLIDVVLASRRDGEAILEKVANGERWGGEIALKGRDGQRFTGFIAGAPLRDVRGELVGAVGVVDDITARKRAEEVLREQEWLFRQLVESVTDLVVVFDHDGSLHYASPSSQEALGVTPAEFTGSTLELLTAMVHPDDRERFRKTFHEVRLTHRPATVTHRMQDRQGEFRWFETTFRTLADPSHTTRYLAASRDVTLRVGCEERLEHLALHDPLTGMPNRTYFIRRLEELIDGAAGRSRRFAVLFLDLDNFKLINDSLGHGRGDELLIAVSERLKSCLRFDDTLARLGGDEFAILVRAVGGPTEAIEVAEQVLHQLHDPFEVGGTEIFVTASVGVVVSTPNHQRADDLLRDADVAMYRAKQKGKNQYELFSPSMKERLMARLQMETDLRRAIERNELVVYYQPVVLVDTGRIAGLEALVRWNHPQRGMISPGEFIPLAEETGLILPVGRWVLRQACAQVRRWQEQYPEYRDLVLSVNLSARQLQDHRLVDEVHAALQDSGLSPDCLTLEITESVLVQDLITTTQALRQMKGLGVRLAIDDFGTGYSSLAYLKRFAVDTLKVDRSFVERLGQDCQDSAIVGTVISLAKTLNLKVTGEGIETAEQLQELRALGCDQGQGYYFTRPLPVEQAEAILAGRPGW
jgi:diguanylate cyclase (GGDEF)-like protein/PAS domain S-box-containing protein